MIVDVALGSSLALSGAEPISVTQTEFETFYRETARPLWGYLARICGNRALADDLLQETYLRFCRARVPASRNEWRPYVYRIGTNLAADWWRHSGRRATEAVEADVATPDERGGESDLIRRRELDRAFGALKPRERALLWLAYAEGMDHREISRALGLSRGSIKVLLFRARRRLAGVLDRMGIGPEVLS